MNKEKLRYYIIRCVTYPFGLLPYPMIHAVGKGLGLLAYYLLSNFRKRTLSNLALATDLNLKPEEIPSLAKKSFQNLMITCLEYEKFAKEKKISRVAHCENPDTAKQLLKDDKGIIFFCGHQANWEILFLEGTSRMPGVAIGKPVKNKYLYDWVLSIRQKFGGTIIAPRNAIKEGLRTLRQGKFLGIVGDQGMPDSGYCSPFLGRMAWTSPIPAMLSYRSGRPILVATTTRQKAKYLIRYSDPIWPDSTKSMEEEIPRLMKCSLDFLEDSIKKNPDQWLWQHNRWKQQLPGSIPKKFRHDSLCVILPSKRSHFEKVQGALSHFRALYPTEYILFLAPKIYKEELCYLQEEIMWYEDDDDCLLDDYRFKLVFNFTANRKIHSHFKQRAAFAVLDHAMLLKLAKKPSYTPLEEVLTKALSYAR